MDCSGEHAQRMTSEEFDEELEKDVTLCGFARSCETLLELTAQEREEGGRQIREDLQAELERTAMMRGSARRVGSLLSCILHGAEGHLGLPGRHDRVVGNAHAFLAKLLGAAVRVSASRLVCRLLALGVSPTVKHKIFAAPIHCAVGNGDILRQLLSSDTVDKDELDYEGKSPLLLAIIEDHAPSVELLLTAGVDTGLRHQTDLGGHYLLYEDEEESDDWAALDHASCAGRVDLCESLVEKGANVNATSKACSRTPLHAAARGNQVGAIDVLIKLGANVEGEPDSGRDTPIEIAGKAGSLEAITALARHGAVMKNALQFAVMMSELKVVVALLEAGADPNVTNFEGNTPLHTAASRWHGEEISRALLEHGAEVEALDARGRTPLHVAVYEGSKHAGGAIDFFIGEAKPAALDRGDAFGLTPLHLACMKEDCYAITALLSGGADITAQDHSGESPLHLAVNCERVVDILLRAGAHVGAVNIVGSNALHLACYYGSRAVAATLLKYDSGILHVQNLKGDTPLHAAAAAAEEDEVYPRRGCHRRASAVTVVDMLLKAGADESVTNNDGYTAFLMPILNGAASGRSWPSKKALLVCALIFRAPADRAWRRRGLLLLCRAFAEKAQLEPGGRRDKLARVSEGGDVADDDGGGRCASIGYSSCAGDFAGLVARLFDLPEEGVFRKIICFL